MAHSISIYDHLVALLQPAKFLLIKIIQHNSELDKHLVSWTEIYHSLMTNHVLPYALVLIRGGPTGSRMKKSKICPEVVRIKCLSKLCQTD